MSLTVMISRFRAAALVLSLAAGTALHAQSPSDTLIARRMQVSLLTFGQGTPVFERFGHNALRIHDPATALDVSWNWGMFSFEDPNFLGRFLKGTQRYWMAGFETVPLLTYYKENDRQTVEQELNLSGAQKAALLKFVRWNELEENKFYHYDYFKDNCSTRVRDALDGVLGGVLKHAWRDSLSAFSYRSEALRLTEGTPLSRLGIDIALGPSADTRMTVWEEAYVPMRLRDRLRGVRVIGDSGKLVPLVKNERVLHTAMRDAEVGVATPLPRTYMLVALGSLLPLALLGGIAFLSALRGRWEGAQRGSRYGIAAISAIWYLATGLVGLLVVCMELFSAHVFWYGNWNVLLLTPVGIVAAWFVPRAIATGRGGAAARWLAGFNGACAMVGLVLSMAGITQQATGAVAIAFAPTMMYLALLVPALTLIRPPRS